MSRKILYLILIAIGAWATARFCHHQTKGFRLTKIAANTSPYPIEHSPSKLELDHYLKQKYRYLNRGLQSFSFVSENGEVVLKLFNNRYQRRLFWLQFVPFTQKKRNLAREKWTRTFRSYQIASEKLVEEAGLLYFHPHASESPLPVTIIDPIGIAHHINLAQYGFVLQKKAQMTYSKISECMKINAPESITPTFLSLLSLLKRKMELGIVDSDPLIRTNFGFVGDRAMQIDIGPFTMSEEIMDEDKQQTELRKIILPLKHWLEKNYPELVEKLEYALESV